MTSLAGLLISPIVPLTILVTSEKLKFQKNSYFWKYEESYHIPAGRGRDKRTSEWWVGGRIRKNRDVLVWPGRLVYDSKYLNKTSKLPSWSVDSTNNTPHNFITPATIQYTLALSGPAFRPRRVKLHWCMWTALSRYLSLSQPPFP